MVPAIRLRSEYRAGSVNDTSNGALVVAEIRVGQQTNIQDLCMVHPDPDVPLRIGRDVTVGHKAVIHWVCSRQASSVSWPTAIARA